MTIMSYLGAIGAAQREAMDADSRVIIMRSEERRVGKECA